MNSAILTQKQLKQQLHYNPLTGLFTRKASNSNRVKIGDRAGYICKSGYIETNVLGRRYYAHRLAWLFVYGEFPNEEIDHINHIRDDNRIKNIRLSSRSENSHNMSKNKNNTSGVTGVYWNKKAGRWRAQIVVKDNNICLGLFPKLEDAVEARKKANLKYGFHKNHGASLHS